MEAVGRFAAVVVALGALAATGAAESPGETIRIAGSGTLAPVLERLAAAFGATHPEVEFQIEGRGSSTGPAALLRGRADLAALSRPLREAERKAFRRRFGDEPSAFPLAVDAVVVYVNPDNPVERLNLTEVDAIFSKTRRCGGERSLRRWGEVGATGPQAERRILPFGRDSQSGTRAWFRETALCDGRFRDDVREQPGPDSVRLSVAESRYAIGYGGLAALRARDVKALALAPAAGSAFAPADAETIQAGRYPLTRRLLLYASPGDGRAPSPAVAAFLAFALSDEGRAIVEGEGYLPLPPEEVRAGLSRLERP